MEPQNPATDAISHIPWHPAFVEALRLELEQYEDALEFAVERPLTTEPLKIDVIVIKKAKDVVITKNIAAIFRAANIIEYKSPDDYVSIADFYKVYGYACLYSSLQTIPITDITVTFVESRHPRTLLAHLREARQYTVAEQSPGMYTVSGDIVPIQIIDSRKLSADENLWLKHLGNRVDARSLGRITAEIRRKGKAARIRAYVYAIVQANAASIREVMAMSDSAVTFDQVVEEVGLAARWEARGEVRG